MLTTLLPRNSCQGTLVSYSSNVYNLAYQRRRSDGPALHGKQRRGLLCSSVSSLPGALNKGPNTCPFRFLLILFSLVLLLFTASPVFAEQAKIDTNKQSQSTPTNSDIKNLQVMKRAISGILSNQVMLPRILLRASITHHWQRGPHLFKTFMAAADIGFSFAPPPGAAWGVGTAVGGFIGDKSAAGRVISVGSATSGVLKGYSFEKASGFVGSAFSLAEAVDSYHKGDGFGVASATLKSVSELGNNLAANALQKAAAKGVGILGSGVEATHGIYELREATKLQKSLEESPLLQTTVTQTLTRFRSAEKQDILNLQAARAQTGTESTGRKGQTPSTGQTRMAGSTGYSAPSDGSLKVEAITDSNRPTKILILDPPEATELGLQNTGSTSRQIPALQGASASAGPSVGGIYLDGPHSYKHTMTWMPSLKEKRKMQKLFQRSERQ